MTDKILTFKPRPVAEPRPIDPTGGLTVLGAHDPNAAGDYVAVCVGEEPTTKERCHQVVLVSRPGAGQPLHMLIAFEETPNGYALCRDIAETVAKAMRLVDENNGTTDGGQAA